MKIALVILLSFVGLVVTGAIVAGPHLRDTFTSLAPKPQGTKVRFQTIAHGSLTEVVKAPGQIEPHTKVDISAEISARIEKLPFDEGETVRKGDMVVKLDDRDLKAALASSEARRDAELFRLQSEQSRLHGLISSLSFADRQLERKQALYDSGDLSRKELDDALERVEDIKAQADGTKHTISVVESTIAGANADIARAEENLSKTVIRAPMDGVMTARNAEIGEVVLVGTMNNPGTVIMTIADLSRMIMKAEVSETDIAKVEEGHSARIHINAYPEEVFSGTVTHIALQRTNKMDGTGYFETEIEIDLRGKNIFSGLIANADIEVATHKGLLVESQAVVDRVIEELPQSIRRENPLVDRAKKTVAVAYCVVENKTVCTPVKQGPSNDTDSVIVAGLNEGDVVVVGPYKALEKIKHDEPVMDESTMPDEDDSDSRQDNDERKSS